MIEQSQAYSRKTLTRLIEIGIALSSVRELKELLKLITKEARELTHSDGGSLYIVEGDRLRFVVSQSASLDKGEGTTIIRAAFKEFTIPISKDSIAGYAALTQEVEVIDDAYAIPEDKPYRHSKIFDEQNDYVTRSILTVPMLDGGGEVIGVLQLINHLNENNQPAPFPEESLPLVQAMASQAAVAIRNTQLTDELKELHYDTVIRLSTAAEFRDNETANHVQRVSHYSEIIARNLGLGPRHRELIKVTSPMHDIGKIGIPDKILLKPGRFTPEERKEMEKHAELGAAIMAGSSSALLQMCEVVAISHHEKWDGSGYPHGLKGEDIPIEGRIVAVADVFDAIASKRVYKDATPFEKVLPIIKESSGTHFDPECVDAFFRSISEIRKIHEDLRD